MCQENTTRKWTQDDFILKTIAANSVLMEDPLISFLSLEIKKKNNIERHASAELNFEARFFLIRKKAARALMAFYVVQY